MENRGLLFIPDISGFTRFINESEIEHSRLIISELLEVLINANQLQLEISEIEGDAILFYKFGEKPNLEELYAQVENMFCTFHRHLNAYELRRFCNCKACLAAVDLTLKIITHYGEFTDYNVKQFRKLIGKDIIVAHQLLKNDIPQHEYWLITKDLLPVDPPAQLAEWMKWGASIKQTETGTIPFHYTNLTQLRNELPPEPIPNSDIKGKTKILSGSREYEADMITLFHGSGDFNHRPLWQEGVTSVKGVSHYLPRVGMRCICIYGDKEIALQSSSISYTPERIQFSESDESGNTTYYLLEQVNPTRSKLTISYYLPKNLFRELIFRISEKKKKEKMLEKSLDNLEKVLKEIVY